MNKATSNDGVIPQAVVREMVELSRSIGSDPSMVVYGGGNTSIKFNSLDHRGRERPILLIKVSGTDLATIEEDGFIGLFLDDLEALKACEELSDREMVEYFRHCRVDPSDEMPSVETLLHAWLPGKFVVHVHADAICALTNVEDGARKVTAALGDRVAYVPYIRPGFGLAKRVADIGAMEAVVLAHHGLVVWGESADEVSSSCRELVKRANDYLSGVGSGTEARVNSVDALTEDEKNQVLLRLRGLASIMTPKILHLRESARSFSDRPDAQALLDAGPATADHILRMSKGGVYVGDVGEISGSVARYRKEYLAYWERNNSRLSDEIVMHEPVPSVFLIPGLGLITTGATRRDAILAADAAEHSLAVASVARSAFGSAVALTEQEIFDVDYWPLELAKIAPHAGELVGRVVVVTGSASGIGKEIARHLAKLGACMVLTDRSEDALNSIVKELDATGEGAIGIPGDITNDLVVRKIFRTGIKEFGGIDGVVSGAGIAVGGTIDELSVEDIERSLAVNLTAHFLVTQHAFRVFRQQGMGGSIVYIASKNAFAPGSGFAAYSAAKAGEVQLGRIAAIEGGKDGVRANVVNPDAIFKGSALWSTDVIASRAAAHGVSEEELQEFYARRNLLGIPVESTDVAEAVSFLLSNRSRVTTGCVVTVDGGVVEAFPR